MENLNQSVEKQRQQQQRKQHQQNPENMVCLYHLITPMQQHLEILIHTWQYEGCGLHQTRHMHSRWNKQIKLFEVVLPPGLHVLLTGRGLQHGLHFKKSLI